MDKILSFLLIVVGLYKVIYSFIENLTVGTLFGSEINIWLYRLLWFSVIVFGVISVIKKFKQQSKE
ncbi:hypothetical protein ULMS_08430 [Patiriisocius marinistellae]|uniref:Uncharacterized protein n=1 Tax=Patiriisocius marinistellae TaxID=2494560 RepID=A0A5J4FZ98_9FLAO|nr:hypothetical protein ULMS_08430 [Patiriisocius marinistellae]